MTFLAPIWLLGLLPWTAVTVFLLVGRRRRVRIPFLELWKIPIETPKPKKRIGPPPLGLVLAMLAMLMAVLAAGRPAVRGKGAKTSITVIVDRGISMSIGQRYVAGAREVAEGLKDVDGSKPAIDLVFVPSLRSHSPPLVKLDRNAFLRAVEAAPPTAVDTDDVLAATVAQRRARSSDPIVVVSDRKLGNSGGEIIQVVPKGEVRNIGISKLVARGAPTPQVMVEVSSIGIPDGVATMHVTTGGATVSQRIDLALLHRRNGTAPYFMDVAQLGPTVEGSLEFEDDFSADNRAWLVRQGSWPRLEPQAALPAGVDRVIRMYSAGRPASEESGIVPIVSSLSRLTNTPGIVVDERAASQPEQTLSAGGITVSDHPVTKDVKWETVSPVRIAPEGELGDGWTPVVAAGERVLVAVRETPVRQVWVGFDSAQWQRSAEFVVFWANVFEWVGRSGPVYSAQLLDSGDEGESGGTGKGWQAVNVPRRPAAQGADPLEWPGLYRRSDGTLVAVNPPVARPRNATPGPWREALAARPKGANSMDLTPWGLLGAMGLMILAAGAWKRSSLTGFSGTFTVTPAEKTVDDARSDLGA